jgi:hypothetical protein
MLTLFCPRLNLMSFSTGIPNMEVIIKGGIHGDIATVAMIVNSIHQVVAAPAGLIAMKDLPVICALGGDAQATL